MQHIYDESAGGWTEVVAARFEQTSSSHVDDSVRANELCIVAVDLQAMNNMDDARIKILKGDITRTVPHTHTTHHALIHTHTRSGQ